MEWLFQPRFLAKMKTTAYCYLRPHLNLAQTETPNCTGKKFNKKTMPCNYNYNLILVKLEISLNINT